MKTLLRHVTNRERGRGPAEWVSVIAHPRSGIGGEVIPFLAASYSSRCPASFGGLADAPNPWITWLASV
jgi:hypothetical protein